MIIVAAVAFVNYYYKKTASALTLNKVPEYH